MLKTLRPSLRLVSTIYSVLYRGGGKEPIGGSKFHELRKPYKFIGFSIAMPPNHMFLYSGEREIYVL